jgi:hypothetical protein
MAGKKPDLTLVKSLLEQPGKKTITWTDYQALLHATYGTEQYDRLQGVSPVGAAAGLNMSHEALQRAIDRGSLDVWYVYDGYVPGVRKLKTVSVTTESIARFRIRSHRRN